MDLSAYKPKTSTSSSSGGGGGGGGGGVNHDISKIFVGGLSWQTTEETLRYHFEQYGEVVSVEVMRDRNTGDPRGFAFVVFKEDAIVDLVMSNLPHEINHKVVDVKRAQARGMAPPSIHKDGPGGGVGGAPQQSSGGNSSTFIKEENDNSSVRSGGGNSGHGGGNSGGGNSGGQTTNNDSLSPEQLQNKIFVGGLPLHLTRDGLKVFFTQFGLVVDAIIMMDAAQSRSRGFGFVTFENGSGGAQLALSSQPIYIDKKYVEIKLATPKGDQQNHNGNQGGGGGGGSGSGNQSGGGGGSGGNHKSKYQNQAPGLRNAAAASMAYQSKGEYAGLAASYGRNGWRAGYGTIAFGSSGWNVKGWEDLSTAPEQSGFTFALLEKARLRKEGSSSSNSTSKSNSSSNRRQQQQKQKRGSSSSEKRDTKRQRQS